MKFTRITDPLVGERTVTVLPRPVPEVSAPWVRQRFVTGRAVSSNALEGEQDQRAGRVVAVGSAMAPGIVSGLEISLQIDENKRPRLINLGSGWGLCASGEDVIVPASLLVEAGKLGVTVTASTVFGRRTTSTTEPTLAELLALRAAAIRKTGVDTQTLPKTTETPPIFVPPSEESTGSRSDTTGVPKPTPSTESPPIFVPSVEAEAFSVAAESATPLSRSVVGAARLVSAAALVSTDRNINLSDVVINSSRKIRPFMAVLVAEPARVEELAAAGDRAHDSCERDPEAEPFEDWRYVDATRLRWVPLETWPDSVGISAETWFKDGLGNDLDGERLRNRAAWLVFRTEAAATEPLPWTANAVPLALAAFSATGDILWLDRAAVARRGGHHRPPPTGVEVGDEALWAAQVEQLSEHLAGLTLHADRPLTDNLRFLPPAGVLSRELFDLDLRRSSALPKGWAINAVPIPMGQIDAALRGAAPLAPFDLSESGDELKLLFPVPESVWEPGLLRIASVEPAFHETLRACEARRDRLLERRGEIRAKISALYAAIGAEVSLPVFPEEDSADASAELVAETVLWRNPNALALFDALGQQESGTLLTTLTALNGATTALLGEEVPAAARLAQVFAGLNVGDPLVVIVTTSDAAMEHAIGNGLALPGGFVDSFMITEPDDSQAVARAPYLYIVPGAVDTEALDRASALAGSRPLVVLCGSVLPIAAEDLAFRDKNGKAPLVCALRLPAADADLRLRDLIIRLGATKNGAHDEHFSASTAQWVVAEPSRTVLVLGSTAANTATAPHIATLNAARAVPTNSAAVNAALDARLTALQSKAGVLVVPADGPKSRDEVAFAARCIASLRQLQDPASLGELGLLTVASAQEGSLGTVPTPEGLGVAAIEEAFAAMEARVTPPDETRVVSDAELSLLGSIGIAGLMAVLTEKADRADDAADFGFLQLKGVLFRVREQLLGRDKALAMSTSPMIAELADLIEGDGSPEQLATFFEELKQAAADSAGPPPTQPKWLTETIAYQIPKLVLYDVLGGYNPTSPLTEAVTSYKVSSASAVVNVTPPTSTTKSTAKDTSSALAKLGTTKRVTYAAPKMLLSPMSLDFAAADEPLAMATSSNTTTTTTTHTTTTAGWVTPSFSAALKAGSPNAAQLGTSSVSVAKMVQADRFLKVAQPFPWTLRNTGFIRKDPPAKSVALRQAAFRLRASIIQTVARLELNLAGVAFPGFLDPVSGGTPQMVSKVLVGGPIATELLVAEVLQGKHDLATADADAPSLAADAISSLEISAAILRIIESRVREVRECVEVCRRAKITIEQLIHAAESRDDAVNALLAEARQDVSTTSALLHEEADRIDALNKRRASALANDVPFVLFHRARMVSLADDVPTHDIEPALRRSPVLDALRRPALKAPDELREMVELWRDAPARWLVDLAPLIPRVDRWDVLAAALEDARQRAVRALDRQITPNIRLTGLRGMEAVGGLVQLRRAAVVTTRQVATTLDYSALRALSWQQALAHALRAFSVADLINGRQVRATVSKRAAAEVESIYKVAAALYTEFASVAPDLRALWVRGLSEYDAGYDLRDLSRLPNWHQVGQPENDRRGDPFLRRELQAMVTWLFDRVDRSEPDAIALCNDLVRVCLLLASHAPVGQLISGAAELATPVEPGRLLHIRVDIKRVRIGMIALVQSKTGLLARAVVEDMSDGRASARLISEARPGAIISAGDIIHFTEPDGVGLSSDDDDDEARHKNGTVFNYSWKPADR